jgi:nicotinic acetylcholine receptor
MQEWFDQRLVWNASDFNGLSTLRLPCSKIWLPDIVLYNSADDYTQGYYQSKAMVENNGHVFWPPPSFKIDVTFLPFDVKKISFFFYRHFFFFIKKINYVN